MTESAANTLPLWRLLLGCAVLGSLLFFAFALGPIYVDDYRFKHRVQAYASSGHLANISDEQIRLDVVKQAANLDLPLRQGDVTVSHPGGRVWLDVRYMVDVNFPLYNVDLHFHTSAEGR